MTKPFNIPKALIWEAFKKVKENGGAPGVDHESIEQFEKHLKNNLSVHDKFHRTLILSGFCLLKIAKISLNSSFFPKPIKR